MRQLASMFHDHTEIATVDERAAAGHTMKCSVSVSVVQPWVSPTIFFSPFSSMQDELGSFMIVAAGHLDQSPTI